MRFDLHMHTTRHSPDSDMEPAALLQRAQEIGLDGIVITEHDWLWTEAELEELRQEAPGLVIFSGIEVSAWEGHFLVYGVTNPFKVPRGIKVAALCNEVHRQGGAVVAAHPFRFGQRFDEIIDREKPDLDGLELMTKNMDETIRRKAAEMQARLGIAGLGSSDAHHESALGFCHTIFEAEIRTVSDLVQAIRQQRLRAQSGTPIGSGASVGKG